MFCKTCGTNLADNSVFCPNCGNTVHKANPNPQPAYQNQKYGGYQQHNNYAQTQSLQQNNYGQTQSVGYQQYNGYASGSMQNRPTGKIDIFKPIFLLSAVIFIIIGIFNLPFCRSAYSRSNDVYDGLAMSELITDIRAAGLDEYLELLDEDSEKEVKITLVALAVDVVMTVGAGIFAVIAIVHLFFKKEKSSLKMLGVSLFFPMIGYIMNMIAGAAQKNADRGPIDDWVKISLVPVIMALVCIALTVLAFMAAKSDERNHAA